MKKFKLILSILIGMMMTGAHAQTLVKGRVIFDGTVPAPEIIEVKSDVPSCGSSKSTHKILLGKDQGVVYAVVRIIGAQGKIEPQTGKLDQVNCEFQPHVQVLSVGSILNISSSDSVLHNSHGFYEDGSTAFNIAVPFAGVEMPVALDKPGVIKLRCDAGHTWMSAYVVVAESPFTKLTDSDGNFSIDGVPAGSYEIEVWQEWLGAIRQPLVVKEGDSEPVIIHLKEK